MRALLTRGLTCKKRGINGIAEGIGRAIERGSGWKETDGIVDDPFDGDQYL